MAKYKLSEYEQNGYHDSYGYLVYWNTETNKIEQISHWSTTGYGGPDISDILMPTKDIVEQAVAYMGRKIGKTIIRGYIRSHYSPTDLNHLEFGDKVIFKKKHSFRKTKKVAEVGAEAEVVSVQLDQYKSSYSDFDWYTVTVRFLDGSFGTVPIDKLRKAGKPDFKVSEVYKRATEFVRHTGRFHYGAWDSTNWALKALNDTVDETIIA